MAKELDFLLRTAAHQQLSLGAEDAVAEDPDYVSRQLITYIGNKRSLLSNIGSAVEQVKRRLGKQKLRMFDVFSGSGVVSRYLKAHASMLYSNDIEDYAYVIAQCYLRNHSTVNRQEIASITEELNHRVTAAPFAQGFIEELYAPQDETNICPTDRVFYTKDNARRLDNYRRLINTIPDDLQHLFLAPLLSKASIHANTAGVFKGFYKNRHTKVGQFGGSGSDALTRIKGTILLEPVILSRFECEYQVFQEDANRVAHKVQNLDMAYLDPPYNQHPYGSNYFMLNLLVHYKKPEHISRIAGIPNDWKRSGYNVRAQSYALFKDLCYNLDAKFLLISYNNEGFISADQMHRLLAELGRVEVFEIHYNAFRGSRNFKHRSIHVTEQLFLVEKK